MNTIILSSTEHLKPLAIASATLEDKTIFIINDYSMFDKPALTAKLSVLQADRAPRERRKIEDQSWQKEWWRH